MRNRLERVTKASWGLSHYKRAIEVRREAT